MFMGSKISSVGVFLLFVGSTLADSANMIPCMAIIAFGLVLEAIGIYKTKVRREDED